MDTVRVKICYRPLRVCWAIAEGDRDGFRRAVRFNHTMWGGRFNPIVVADRVDEATEIVESFRADMIVPIGESEVVKSFPKRFPQLIHPFFHEELFIDTHRPGEARAQFLDIHNALVKLREIPEWKTINDRGVHVYTWDANDPLSDIFLMQLGAYPDIAETHIDYREILKRASSPAEHHIDPNAPLPAAILDHPSISYFSRHGIERHYSLRSGWDHPGFYLGDASDLDDLLYFWNVRATDTALWFLDRNHVARYEQILPVWSKTTADKLAMRRDNFPPGVAVWSQRSFQADHEAYSAELRRIFGDGPLTVCGLDPGFWHLRAPMMVLGESAQLGVLSDGGEKPKLSFALDDKPFCGDIWFHSQHLVASLSFVGGLYGDDLHTLVPPYVPELNEFYARTMHFEYNKFRVEPERIGLIIDAADSDAFIYALPVPALFEELFSLAGLSAKPSASGLITRQLISQLGGLRGAAVFKIPGARRLLRTYGPTEAFTAKSALQLIGSKDPENPDAKFGDYEDLYIEARPHGTKLTPKGVFTYLVEKRLFRIGSQLTCPHCRMTSWTALDNLKQRTTCEMCGRDFDATRQLMDGVTHYRRSGVLGTERNAQGAIPVVLTLQQLDANLSHTLYNNMYSTSLELKPKSGNTVPECEVDFVWMVAGAYPEKTTIIVAECKDRGRNSGAGSDGGTISATDIANLKQVADAFPKTRFETYVLLAKLCPFTESEIAAAKELNGPYRQRVIMLTARELEPWHLYERTAKEFQIDRYAGSEADLARNTAAIYFAPATPSTGQQAD
jgi:hypothetical protein